MDRPGPGILLPDIVKYLPFNVATAPVATVGGGGFGGGARIAALDANTATVLVAAWLIGSLAVAALFMERAEISGWCDSRFCGDTSRSRQVQGANGPFGTGSGNRPGKSFDRELSTPVVSRSRRIAASTGRARPAAMCYSRPDCRLASGEMMGTPVIEVANLCKRYGDRLVVDDVSFDVGRGEIFGILGRNGAGKSTTVECIEGLRRPDSGTIRVLGLDPRRDRAALRERVGVQLQESQLPDGIRVWEALDLYASFYRKPADWRPLVDLLGLGEKRNTAFRKLSGGQKQRLSAALALVGNPEIAMLDELTTGLDPHARRETWELVEGIRTRGVTVVLVTHYLDEAERLCDRLALLDAGRMIAVDTPAGLVSRVDAEQRIRFRPSQPLPEGLLSGLPEVTGLETSGPWVVVKGTGNLLLAVTGVLARADVVALELRVEQGTLEDAFIALTGHGPEADMAATE